MLSSTHADLLVPVGWESSLTLSNPNQVSGSFFGNALSAVGSQILVGAWDDDSGATNAGAAYLFDRDGNLLLEFLNPSPGPTDRFGSALASDGSKILIAAYLDDTDATGGGIVYLFDASDGSLLHTFHDPNSAINNQFGSQVAIAGGRAFISAIGDDTTGDSDGVVHVFDCDTQSSSFGDLLFSIATPDIGSSGHFGGRLLIANEQLIVGARFADLGGFDSGAAFVFDLDGNLGVTLTSPDPKASDRFGIGLAATGNRLLVGEIEDGVFEFDDEANFVRRFSENGIGGSFGWSIAYHQADVVIGSGGEVFVYEPNDTIKDFVISHSDPVSRIGSSLLSLGRDLWIGDSDGINGGLEVVYRISKSAPTIEVAQLVTCPSTKNVTVSTGWPSNHAFVVVNPNNVPIPITSVDLQTNSRNPNFFSISPATGSVPAKGFLAFNVRFNPEPDVGSRAPGYNPEKVTILLHSGGVQAASFRLSVKPDTYVPARRTYEFCHIDGADFGEVAIGDVKTHSAVIVGTGNSDVPFSQISFDNPDFSVSPSTLTLVSATAKELLVTYQPSSLGSQTSILTFDSPRNDISNSGNIPFSGTGVGDPEPEISLSSTGLDFSDVLSGQSATQTLTISNIGSADLLVIDIVSSLSTEQFTVSTSSFTVSAGGSQDVIVTFTPGSDAGSVFGALTVNSNDTDEGSVSVSLSGTGTAPSAPNLMLTSSYPELNIPTAGSVWADYDGDGDPDLFVWGDSGSDHLFRNDGDRFTEVTTVAGIQSAPNSIGAAWADYDNDGDPDLYVSRENHPNNSLDPADRLFRNDSGTFIEVGVSVGLGRTGNSRWPIWGDYDKDGDLDLYVNDNTTPNSLYRNDGSDGFREVSGEVGLADEPNTPGGAAWVDFDNDGDLDLHVTRWDVADQLFRNDVGFRSNAHFSDVAASLGLSDQGKGSQPLWADFDNNGYLDLSLARAVPPHKLYKNLDGVRFEDMTRVLPVGTGGGSTASADYDNDGDLDLFISFGDPNDPNTLQKTKKLFENRGSWVFEDVSERLDVTLDSFGDRMAWADVNGDGHIDLFVPQVAFGTNESHLFLNSGGTGNWLTVRLQGTQSQRDGLGARVTVAHAEGVLSREASADSGYPSATGFTMHFGLGSSPTADIEVLWPSIWIQRLDGVVANQSVVIVAEPEISLSATTLSFGSIEVGQSGLQTLTVSNTGPGTLTVMDVGTSDGPFTPSFASFTVPAGGSQDVTITFTPSSATTHTGTLTIDSDDPDEGSLSISLTGSGSATNVVDPDIQVLPSLIAFKNTDVGDSEAVVLTISNVGSEDLTITSITSTSLEFLANPVSFIVAPATAQTVTVTFSPTTPGIRSGSLNILTNDPDQPTVNIPVAGEAFGVALALQISSVRIDGRLVGTEEVGSLAPTISWSLDVISEGDHQTAYQIQVGSVPGLLDMDLWDSDSVAVTIRRATYAGNQLAWNTNYGLRIRVWNTAGVVSNWKEFDFTTLDNRAPNVRIISPDNDEVVWSEEGHVRFAGSAIDGDENGIAIDSIRWASDIQGLLRSAPGQDVTFEIPVPELNIGQHTVTLTAWDNEGDSASTEATLTILGLAPISSIDTATAGDLAFDPDGRKLFALWGSDILRFSGSGEDKDEFGEAIVEHVWTIRSLDDLESTERLLSDLGRFEIAASDATEVGVQSGVYEVYYRVVDDEGVESEADSLKVIIRPDIGRAIIVAGGGYQGENRDAFYSYTSSVANKTYSLLVNQRRFSHEAITYLSPIGDWGVDYRDAIRVVDTDVSVKRLQYAIEATRESNVDGIPLVVFLAGHGGDGVFFLSDTEELSGEDFASWLHALNEAKVTSRGLAGPEEIPPGEVVIVVDFCFSRRFLERISGPGRVVIGSSSDRVASVTRAGESFGSFFFEGTAKGWDVLRSFEEARDRIRGIFDQEPYVDANGDGIPLYGTELNVRNPGTEEDVRILRNIDIGGFINLSRLAPEIYTAEVIEGEDPGSVTVLARADIGLTLTLSVIPSSFDPGAEATIEALRSVDLEITDTTGDTSLYVGTTEIEQGVDYILLVQGIDALGNVVGHKALVFSRSSLMGDFDGDGAVGFQDFLLFAQHFGLIAADAGWDQRFDLDRDGSIGFGDFIAFAAAFGTAE